MQTQTRTAHSQNPVIIADGENIDQIAALASGETDGFEFEPIPLSQAALHLERPLRSAHRDLTDGAEETALVGEDREEQDARFSWAAQGATSHDSHRETEDGDDLALPIPPVRPSPVAGVVRPSGRINRRVIMVAVVVAALVVLLAFGLGKSKSAENSPVADADVKGENKPDSTLRVNHPNDASLRSPETNYAAPTGDQAAAAESEARYLGMSPAPGAVPQSGALPSTPVSYTPTSSNPAPSGDTSTNPRYTPASSSPEGSVSFGTKGNYAVAMRAGQGSLSAQTSAVFQGTADQVASVTQRGADGIERMAGQKQANAQSSSLVRLPAGTRIPMTLLEPIQSGIETTVEARVDADIRDAQGQLLLRNGQKLSIPFLSSHTNGRMLNAPSQIDVQLPDGRTLVFAGSVKGPDGLAGLTGKITKTGTGSTFGRVLHGVARTGVQAAETVIGRSGAMNSGISTSDIGLDDSVADRYGPSSQRAPREVVNISAGIRFSFVVVK